MKTNVAGWLTVFATIGFLQGCQFGDQEGDQEAEVYRGPPIGQGASDCPHGPDESQRFSRLPTPGDASAAISQLVGDIASVPEFHDCQRFVVRDGGVERFDSAYAIYISQAWVTAQLGGGGIPILFPGDAGGGTTGTVGTGGTGGTGTPVGGGGGAPGTGSGTGGAGGTGTQPFEWPETLIGRGYLAGVIVAWGDYDPLGITRGVSCVYLARRNSAGDWAAGVVKLFEDPNAPTVLCPPIDVIAQSAEESTTPGRPAPPGPPNTPQVASGTALTPAPGFSGRVLPVSAPALEPEFDASDIPAATRWEWDDASGRQFIGFPCGDEWCTIGPPGPSPILAHDAPPETGVGKIERRTRRIKGWYDEQILAVKENGRLVPGGVIATVYPHPALGQRGVARHFAGKWVLTAEVSLRSALDQYLPKLNLSVAQPAKFLGTLNRVYLCQGTAEVCLGSTSGLDAMDGTTVATLTVPDPTSITTQANSFVNCTSGWFARIERTNVGSSAPDQTLYRCVRRRPVPATVTAAGPVPATARWHFLNNDDTIWVLCEAGCCEVCDPADPNGCD